MKRPPFLNPDYEYEEDIWDFDDEPERPSGELLALFLQDMKNREEGKVAPVTTGVDYYFLDDFFTRDMKLDFPLIEQDFIEHCNGRLKEFNDVGWYGDNDRWNGAPRDVLQKKILRLIYNGAKIGDRYCVELIKNLYKTYHKKEYDQLKRFSTISSHELSSLSENEWGDTDSCIMGRILGMCRFMNIRQDDSCSLIYLYLESNRRKILKWKEDEKEPFAFADGLFEECLQQVEAWTGKEELSFFGKSSKSFDVYHENYDFVWNCLDHFGYPPDYVYLCLENDMGPRIQMARTLAVLKTANPKREYTYEEVQKFTVLYSAVAALVDVANDFDRELGYLTGDALKDFEKEDMLFKPEKIQYKDNKVKEKPIQHEIINVAPVSNSDADKDDYLKEIALLRARISEKELENRNLREMYRQVKNKCSEAEQMNQKYESERDELIALRNFAYQLELEEEEIAEESFEDMKKAIASKDVVVIGGHINWINKLRTQFPKWLFVHPDAYKTIDGKILEGKERVYFFTDYMNHISYQKYIAVVKEKKIPFGYLGTRNVEGIVNQIYKELC